MDLWPIENWMRRTYCARRLACTFHGTSAPTVYGWYCSMQWMVGGGSFVRNERARARKLWYSTKFAHLHWINTRCNDESCRRYSMYLYARNIINGESEGASSISLSLSSLNLPKWTGRHADGGQQQESPRHSFVEWINQQGEKKKWTRVPLIARRQHRCYYPSTHPWGREDNNRHW